MTYPRNARLVGFERDNAVTLVSTDGARIELHSPRAFAPGAPFTLCVNVRDQEMTLQAKSIHSKRIDANMFLVRAKLMNVQRVMREWLTRTGSGEPHAPTADP
jgi:hypothetical protein